MNNKIIRNDKKKCLSCAGCVSICPKGAISFKNGKIIIDKKKCIKCSNCIDFCPVGAMELV
ncbi:MAG: ferredoxin [Candidatus Aenigmarchaeota archaeon ex4484_52]|nr:MAG: ferredoxin [Candidatus Aenigmarchaeota archaeon ex4484_52]